MLQNSVLGTLFDYWRQSRVFAFIRAIFSAFSRAFSKSAIVGFFERDSRVEAAYERSLIARFFRVVIDVLLFLPRKIFAALAPACPGSAVLRACSGSAVFNFEFLLGAFILLMFAMPHAYWSNTYALLASGGLLVLYGLMAAAGKREAFYPHKLGLPFLLFALSCVISLIFTRDMHDSVRVLTFFVSALLLTFVIVAEITDEERLMKLMGFIYAAVMFTALYAVYQRIVGVEVDMLLTDVANNKGVPGRVYSTLDNPNNYAEFLVLFTPLCAAFAMNVKNNAWRFLLSCGVALPMLAMVMTYSRSCWISILAAAIVFVYFAQKKLIPIFFLCCVLAVPFLPASVTTRIMSIFSGNDTSAAHRFYVWDGIFGLLADKGQWLTGIGLGPETFNDVYPEYARKWATEGVFHSQNQYLELFLELGTLGFVSFMWMMFRSVKDAACALYRTHSKVLKSALIACCASFVGIFAAFFAEYVWYYPRVLFAFFILLGICMAATRIYKEKELTS